MRQPRSRPERGLQQGAVLYVALIMLVLLALIGVVGMQVTGLQERMSSNYRNANLAFQNTEKSVRLTERAIEAELSGGAGIYPADLENCETSFEPLSWADGTNAAHPLADSEAAVFVRRIDRCFPQSSIEVGIKQNEETGNVYGVSALASDLPGSATASAVIDTIFIP